MNHFIYLIKASFILTAFVFFDVNAQNKDAFGIPYLMPSASPLLEWNSAHWSGSPSRNIHQDTPDPYDATGWSTPRGDFNLFNIDGNGVLHMGGNQPRLYVQSSQEHPLFFKNTEFTAYFKRIGTDGPFNGGLIMGVRSGINGHGRDNCEATTYYFGIRYPGTWVFYKELTHPFGENGSSGRLLPGSQIMPSDKWIGVKFLTYNIPGTNHVKLEGYVDLESNGDTSAGITWTKVAEIIDDGSWSVPVGDCGYAENKIISEGGGTVLIRNTDIQEAQYKMVSIREINPAGDQPSNLSIHIEAENYSAYNNVQTEACSEGGENVAYIEAGSWMAYENITLPETGTYKIEYRVASPYDNKQFSSDLNSGSIRLGEMDIPNTGGWQNWQTISQTVNIEAGTYSFGLWAMTDGWNINWIKISKVNTNLKLNAEKISTVNVYPNPTFSSISVKGIKTGEIINIFNAKGQKVLSTQNHSDINVSHFKKGIYLIRTATNTQLTFIKE